MNSGKDTNTFYPLSLHDVGDQRYLNSISTFALASYEREKEEIKRGNIVYPFIPTQARLSSASSRRLPQSNICFRSTRSKHRQCGCKAFEHSGAKSL